MLDERGCIGQQHLRGEVEWRAPQAVAGLRDDKLIACNSKIRQSESPGASYDPLAAANARGAAGYQQHGSNDREISQYRNHHILLQMRP